MTATARKGAAYELRFNKNDDLSVEIIDISPDRISPAERHLPSAFHRRDKIPRSNAYRLSRYAVNGAQFFLDVPSPSPSRRSSKRISIQSVRNLNKGSSENLTSPESVRDGGETVGVRKDIGIKPENSPVSAQESGEEQIVKHIPFSVHYETPPRELLFHDCLIPSAIARRIQLDESNIDDYFFTPYGVYDAKRLLQRWQALSPSYAAMWSMPVTTDEAKSTAEMVVDAEKADIRNRRRASSLPPPNVVKAVIDTKEEVSADEAAEEDEAAKVNGVEQAPLDNTTYPMQSSNSQNHEIYRSRRNAHLYSDSEYDLYYRQQHLGAFNQPTHLFAPRPPPPAPLHHNAHFQHRHDIRHGALFRLPPYLGYIYSILSLELSNLSQNALFLSSLYVLKGRQFATGFY
ncbi:uncharacterized protein VTP21DRAFT_1701 [Calcarisporiella thermophila]|uniref:uncharacterized protein n=1 Tax=Calcarisporiella thermophila TaxID=911321 RepID=UPI00374422D3